MASTTAERGQLMLIAAIALALVFVGIALVLNSAIYTENIASQNQGSPGDGAASIEDEAEDSVSDTISDVNEGGNGTRGAGPTPTPGGGGGGPPAKTVAELCSELGGGIEEVQQRLAGANAQRGYSVAFDETNCHPGTQIVDDERDVTDPFTPVDGSVVTWQVSNNSEIRRFQIGVVRGGTLADGVSLSDVETTLDSGGSLVYFWEIDERGSDDEWRTAVWRDGTDVKVMTYDVDDDEFTPVCTRTTAILNVTVSEGTVDGQRCEALDYASDNGGPREFDGPVEVRYWNGNLASGTYRLVVDRRNRSLRDAVDMENYGTHCGLDTYTVPGNGDVPVAVPAIYAADVTIDVQGQSTSYEGTTQVVGPGNITGTTRAPTIEEFNVSADDSSLLGDAEFEVDWNTRDPQGDSVTVRLELYNTTTGDKVDEVTGLSGSGSGEELEGDFTLTSLTSTYDVRIVATDGNAYERMRTQRHVADGDNNACPP